MHYKGRAAPKRAVKGQIKALPFWQFLHHLYIIHPKEPEEGVQQGLDFLSCFYWPQQCFRKGSLKSHSSINMKALLFLASGLKFHAAF